MKTLVVGLLIAAGLTLASLPRTAEAGCCNCYTITPGCVNCGWCWTPPDIQPVSVRTVPAPPTVRFVGLVPPVACWMK